MKKSLRLLALAGLLTAVLSCAILSKDQCETMNWFEKGKTDATEGQSPTRFESYRAACSKHSITADQDAYTKGFAIGLETFCTEDRGYSVGREGFNYQRTCPKDLEAAFLKGYYLGHREFEVKKKEEELIERERKFEREKKRFREDVMSHGSKCTFDSDCRKD